MVNLGQSMDLGSAKCTDQPGLAKLGLKVKSDMSVFLGKTKLFQGKNNSVFAFLLGASYMQKTSAFEFSSLAGEIRFRLIFVDI